MSESAVAASGLPNADLDVESGGCRRAGRRQQMVRRVPRSAEHQPECRARRAHRHLRPVRLRQVDHDPLHQSARGASEGQDRRRRDRAHQRPEEDRRDPPRGRHGVPALQPLPAPDHHRELHAGAYLGQEDAEEAGGRGRHALPDPGEDPRAGSEVSRPALRWPAAARGDRSRALHEPAHHAFRRADLRARPGDDQGSARRHGRRSRRRG